MVKKTSKIISLLIILALMIVCAPTVFAEDNTNMTVNTTEPYINQNTTVTVQVTNASNSSEYYGDNNGYVNYSYRSNTTDPHTQIYDQGNGTAVWDGSQNWTFNFTMKLNTPYIIGVKFVNLTGELSNKTFESDWFTPSYESATLNITNITPDKLLTNQNITVNGTLTDSKGDPIDGVNVTAEYNGIKYYNITSGGNFSFEIGEKLYAGNNTLILTYSGVNAANVTVYKKTDLEEDLSVSLVPTNITITNATNGNFVGEIFNITVNVTANGTNVSKGIVELTINGQVQSTEVNGTGTAEFNWTAVEGNNIIVYARYYDDSGAEIFAQSNGNLTLANITKNNVTAFNLTATDPNPALNSKINITVQIEGVNYTDFTNKSVTIYQGSESYTVTFNSTGAATLVNITMDKAGEFNFTANYSDAKYNLTSNYTVVTVDKVATNINLTGNDTKVLKGQIITLTANVTSSVNVTEGNVTFLLNGITDMGNRPVDKYGIAELNWTVPTTASVNNFTIIAKYSGSDSFNESSNSSFINIVDKLDTNITLKISPDHGINGTEVTLTANVKQNNSAFDMIVNNDGKVEFTADVGGTNISIANVTVVDGIATYVYTINSTGNVTFYANYTNGTQFNDSATSVGVEFDNNASYTITKITVDPATGKANMTVTITATVTSELNSSQFMNGKVVFYLPDGTTQVDYLVDGKATITWTVPADAKVGEDINITANYTSSDGIWKNSTDTATLPIGERINTTTTITVDPETALVDEIINITITVTSDDNTTLVDDGEVKYTIDGVTKIATLVDGSVTITDSFDKNGTYNITALYMGDGEFNPSEDSINYIVSKVGTESHVIVTPVRRAPGENSTIEFTLTTDDGTPLNGTVDYTIYFVDGNTTLDNGTVNVVNGSASMSYLFEDEGIYEITGIYLGNDKFEKSIGINLYPVVDNPVNTTTKFTIVPGTGLVNKTSNITVTVTSDDNSTIGLGFITITIDNVTMPIPLPVVNGSVKGDVTFDEAGNHTITVLYIGDPYFNPSNATIDYIVTDIVLVNTTTEITVDPEIGLVNETVTVTITVTSDNGTPVTGEVQYTIDNFTGKANLTNGSITLPGSFDKEGNYTITAKYLGNVEFNPSDDSINYTVKAEVEPTLTTTDLVMDYKDGSKFTAMVTGTAGQPLENETVSFTINGIKYNRTTDSNGTARLNINLSPGTYNITTTWNKYNITKNNTVTINTWNASNVSIVADDFTKAYRNGTQYTAKVTYNGNAVSGVEVTVNVNGKNYTRTTDANGMITLNINLGVGEYNVTSTVSAANTTTEDVAEVTVIKADSALSSASTTVARGSQYVVTLTGTISTSYPIPKQATVVITVNGKNYTRTTDDNGQAKLNIRTLPVGNYPILVAFAGNNDVKAATSLNQTLTVTE